MTKREHSGRVPLMVGNWKMFKTSREGVASCATWPGNRRSERQEVMVAPPFTGLYEAVRAAEGTLRLDRRPGCLLGVGGGVHRRGVCRACWPTLGVKAAIIGHSERRQYFGETDEWVAKKVWAALDRGLLPIMCVGETEDERDGGVDRRGARQTGTGWVWPPLRSGRRERIAVAYEPVWAIGTGKTATPEMAQEAMAFVRDEVRARWAGSGREEVRDPIWGKRGARQHRRVDGASRTSTACWWGERVCRWALSRVSCSLREAVTGCLPRDARSGGGPRSSSSTAGAMRRRAPAMPSHWPTPPSGMRFGRPIRTCLLEASGEAVGLPPGVMGNSEVGHLTLGRAGSSTRIFRASTGP